MTWTIVLIHKGKQDYLRYNLQILTQLSPHCSIIVAGDESNEQLVKQNRGCMWLSIKDLIQSDAAYHLFNQNYKHFSVNPFEYEKFCFERWFILLNLAKSNQLQKFIYLDTDNVLLVSPSYFLESYTSYDYGQIQYAGQPEFVFFQNINVLSEFCNYLNSFYLNSTEVIEKLVLRNVEKIYAEKIWGGTCPYGANLHFSDLFAMLDFWENVQRSGNEIYSFETQAFRNILIPKYMTNKSINIDRFWKYKSNIYRFDGKECSLSVLEEDRWMRVNMVHFQGNDKEYMRDFYFKFMRAISQKTQFQYKIFPPSKFYRGLQRVYRLFVKLQRLVTG
jgi:hypothetical protein